MKSFYRYLIPSVLASVFMSAYAIIDGMFIGQKIGDVGLSAINIAWPITSFLQCIGTALGLSGGIYISTLRGLNRSEESGRMKLTTILVIIFLSIILGGILFLTCEPILILFGAEGECLEYASSYIRIILMGSLFQMLGVGLIPLLKNSGKAHFAMLASVISILVNLILDFVFIYTLNLGLPGAAIASVIAQVSSCIVCLVPYLQELRGVLFTKDGMKNLFLGSLAPFVLNFSYSFIIIITNALCLTYGGNEAVAAYTLLSYLLYVIGAIGTGVADAIQPLFSYYHASKDRKENDKMLRMCLIISFGLCFCVSVLFYCIQGPLESLYNLSPLASRFYRQALIYYLIGFLCVSLIRVICSYLYSVNDKLRANLLTLAEPLILTPLIYLLLCPFLKLSGVWIGYLVIQITLLIFAVGLLGNNRFRERNKQKKYIQTE